MEIFGLCILMLGLVCVFIKLYTDYKKRKARKQGLKDSIVELKKEEQNLKYSCDSKREKIDTIEQEYETKKKFIEDANKSAQEAYDTRVNLLNSKYAELDKDYEAKKEKFEAVCSTYQEEADALKQELENLQKTKAAAIIAANKDNIDQEEIDAHRLVISEQDKSDITLLSDLKLKISKPRIVSMLIWQSYYKESAQKKFPQILGKDKVCGIYKITNIVNDKSYIGQAVDVRKRWQEHAKAGCDIDRPQGNLLYQDILKYGLENFTFELLLECGKEELDDKEQYFIDFYNSFTYGYNKRNQK